jgi:uncharacterized protein YxeA
MKKFLFIVIIILAVIVILNLSCTNNIHAHRCNIILTRYNNSAQDIQQPPLLLPCIILRLQSALQ